MKIDPKELYSLNFYEYGEAYYGGCGGMRYRVAREPLENVHYTPVDKRGPAVILAQIWPEPLSYAAVDPSAIRSAGLKIMAMAMKILWRKPAENWHG